MWGIKILRERKALRIFTMNVRKNVMQMVVSLDLTVVKSRVQMWIVVKFLKWKEVVGFLKDMTMY